MFDKTGINRFFIVCVVVDILNFVAVMCVAGILYAFGHQGTRMLSKREKYKTLIVLKKLINCHFLRYILFLYVKWNKKTGRTAYLSSKIKKLGFIPK